MYKVEVTMTMMVSKTWKTITETKEFSDEDEANDYYALCYEVGVSAIKNNLPFAHAQGYDSIRLKRGEDIIKAVSRNKSLG